MAGHYELRCGPKLGRDLTVLDWSLHGIKEIGRGSS